jgi:hypothetical protein
VVYERKKSLSIGRKILEADVRVYRIGLRVAPEDFEDLADDCDEPVSENS